MLNALSPSGAAQTILRITAESSPSGVLARIGLKALVGDSSDNSRVAAMFLEALAGGESRVVVQADRFVVTDGSGTKALFEVSGGQIRLAANMIRLTGDVVLDNTFKVQNVNIGDLIQSSNWIAGPSGAGWQINKNGSAIFNDVTIRRQIEVAAGSFAITAGSPPKGTGGAGDHSGEWAVEGASWWVTTTPIRIDAWMGARRTYLATANILATMNAYPGTAPDVYWGMKADILPLTRWEDEAQQTLRLRLGLWSRKIQSWGAGTINWKIYEVS